MPKGYKIEIEENNLLSELEYLDSCVLYRGYFNFEDAVLTIYRYTVDSDEERETCKKLLVEKGICEEKDVDKAINFFLDLIALFNVGSSYLPSLNELTSYFLVIRYEWIKYPPQPSITSKQTIITTINHLLLFAVSTFSIMSPV